MYSHNLYGGGVNNFNKRLSQSKDYVRPKQTKQDTLTNLNNAMYMYIYKYTCRGKCTIHANHI